MKIVFINDYQQKVGGTETYLYSLADELTRQGHQVSFYFGSNDFATSLKKRNTLGGYLRRIANLRHWLAIHQLVKRTQPDVIHIHNLFNEITPLMLVGLPKTKVVLTIHDYQIVQAVFSPPAPGQPACQKPICPGCFRCVGWKGLIFEKLKRWLHNRWLRRVDTFIAPSQYVQKIVRENSQFSPVQLYNGFNLPPHQPYNFNYKAVFSGRLTADKGVKVLLAALPLITQALPSFSLEIIGDGELSSLVKRFITTAHFGQSVKLIPHLTQKVLFSHLYKAAVLLVPSTWQDNLPTICIEALACGRPVIASRVGGIPEIITEGQTGLLVPHDSAPALAETMISFFKSPAVARQLAKNAVAESQKFRLQPHVAALLKLYSTH